MNVLSMRIPHWKLLLAVLGPLLVTGLSRPPAVDFTRGLTESAISVSAPARSAALAKSEKKLPFAISDVVLFLRQNFRISPEDSDRDYALFRYVDRQSDGTNEEILRIAVRTYSNHIWVAFTFREFSRDALCRRVHRSSALYADGKRPTLRTALRGASARVGEGGALPCSRRVVERR